MNNIEDKDIKNIIRFDFLQHRFSQYRAQQSVQLTALRRGLAGSILFNVILLAMVLIIIGGN